MTVAVSVALMFAYPAVEKFCRASSAGPPTALAIKFRELDRVGRRGLSEPGGIFSRLNTFGFPWLEFCRATEILESSVVSRQAAIDRESASNRASSHHHSHQEAEHMRA